MKKKKFFKSTITRIFIIVIIFVLPLNFMTLILSSIAMDNNKEQICDEISKSIESKLDTLDDMLSRGVRRLAYFNSEEEAFIWLGNSKDLSDEQVSLYLTEAKRMLDDYKVEYSLIDMFYFHYPTRDNSVIYSGYPGIARSAIIEKIKSIELTDTKSTKWIVTDMGGVPVLMSTALWRNAHFGVIINLEKLIRNLNLETNSKNTLVYFKNVNDQILTRKGKKFFEENHVLTEQELSKNYEKFSFEINKGGLTLVQWTKHDLIENDLTLATSIMMYLSVALSLIVIPAILIYMNRAVNRPLHQLTKAIDAVESGDLEYRIKQHGHQSREFEMINQNFNGMMNEVKNLKIDVYEKEIEKKDIRMRYLSQQIKPHFIMNALNIIYSYEPEEYDLIQKMVLCISKYFRYVVKMNDAFAELHQEMAHIENYFEIQKARYPDMFFSIVEFDERLRHALVPPLLIQTFAENAIKYSLKSDKKVTILLIAEYKEKENGEPYMRVHLADTGDGITDDILEKIEAFQKTGELQDELGIGVQNSIERLKYLYDDLAHIRIWRDEIYGGTNVEIVLPVYMAEEGVIYDEHFNS